MYEEWKPIPGYEGRYDASHRGRVCSLMSHGRKRKTPLIISQRTEDGYKRVELFREGKRKHFQVHQLIAAAFLGPCPNDKVINHIDGNKSNNFAENLEYVTQRENVLHARDVLHCRFSNGWNKGQKRKAIPIDEIRELAAEGKTRREIAVICNVSTRTVQRHWK
jgi:hypothetical protein